MFRQVLKKRRERLQKFYMSKEKFSIKARKKARRIALQALYGWSISHNPLREIEAFVFKEHEGERFDKDYFRVLLYGVSEKREELEALMSPYLSNREIEDVGLIELNILRIAAFELKERLDIPYRVVINESLELAKTFGATDSFKFVNGVIDKLARELRVV